MTFFYVYILQSEAAPESFYVGFTENLQLRLKTHNSGQVSHTAKSRPWRIKAAIAFTDRQRVESCGKTIKGTSARKPASFRWADCKLSH